MPLSPTKRTPLPHLGGMRPSLRWGGFSAPWYQVTVQAGMSPRGPYSYTARNEAGAISGWGGGPKPSMVFGASSLRAQKGRSFQWLPRSLMVPEPKSHQRYHFGPGK